MLLVKPPRRYYTSGFQQQRMGARDKREMLGITSMIAGFVFTFVGFAEAYSL